MTTTEGLARDGSTVHCDPLPLATSIEFLELIEKYGQGDIGALRRLLLEFPKAVGAGAQTSRVGLGHQSRVD